MPDFDNNYEYFHTVEFGNVLEWTGNFPLTLNGKTYSTGKILAVSDIFTAAEITDSTTVITMAALSPEDRTRYFTDIGPLPCTVQIILRKRPITGGAWSNWTVGQTFNGRLSDGTYDDGTFDIRVQNTFDDVWRGDPKRWTGSHQRRIYPNDSSLDMADEIRRNEVMVRFQA